MYITLTYSFPSNFFFDQQMHMISIRRIKRIPINIITTISMIRGFVKVEVGVGVDETIVVVGVQMSVGQPAVEPQIER